MRKLIIAAALALLTVLPAHAKNAPKPEKTIGEIVWVNGDHSHWRPWKAIVDDILQLAKLHGGEPVHTCFPDEQRCVDSVMIAIKNDGQWERFMLGTFRNARGVVVQNTACWFTRSLDVRECYDYGQTEASLEMKGEDGWHTVEQEPSAKSASSKKDDGGI